MSGFWVFMGAWVYSRSGWSGVVLGVAVLGALSVARWYVGDETVIGLARSAGMVMGQALGVRE